MDQVEIKVLAVTVGCFFIALSIAIYLHILFGNLTGKMSMQLAFTGAVIGMFLFFGGLLYR